MKKLIFGLLSCQAGRKRVISEKKWMNMVLRIFKVKFMDKVQKIIYIHKNFKQRNKIKSLTLSEIVPRSPIDVWRILN